MLCICIAICNFLNAISFIPVFYLNHLVKPISHYVQLADVNERAQTPTFKQFIRDHKQMKDKINTETQVLWSSIQYSFANNLKSPTSNNKVFLGS